PHARDAACSARGVIAQDNGTLTADISKTVLIGGRRHIPGSNTFIVLSLVSPISIITDFARLTSRDSVAINTATTTTVVGSIGSVGSVRTVFATATHDALGGQQHTLWQRLYRLLD
ncbi:unnamed protein product, partial [Ectocarpus sp. 8 AP-2014]